MAEKYARVLRMITEQPWAIQEATLDTICGVVTARASGVKLSKHEIQARVGAANQRPSKQVIGTVAVIPVFGVLAQRMNMFSEISGGTSYQQIAQQFREFRDDESVKAIVFEFDSPGGEVFGLQELADEIFAARETKRLVAMVNANCASAALYLAAACQEIVITPSGMVGSIGCIVAHEDVSAMDEKLGLKRTYITSSPYKSEGHEGVPLTEEAHAHIKSMVDEYGAQFEKFVAKARGVTPGKVRGEFGGGRMLMAKDAKRVGLVDRIATMDEVVAKLAGRKSMAAVRADEAAPAIAAEAELPAVAAEEPVLEVQAEAAPVAAADAPAPLVDVELEDMDLALRLAEHR